MLCSPPLTLSLAPKPKPTRDEIGASYDPAQLQSHSRARSFAVTVHRVQGATLKGDTRACAPELGVLRRCVLAIVVYYE